MCSVAALALIFERALALRRAQVAPAGLVEEVLQVLRQGVPSGDVLGKLAANSTLGNLLASGIRIDRKSTRLNSSHVKRSRMPSSA